VAAKQAERGLSKVDWVETYAPKDLTGQHRVADFQPTDYEYNDDTDGTAKPE
jgi:hypothetical protein